MAYKLYDEMLAARYCLSPSGVRDCDSSRTIQARTAQYWLVLVILSCSACFWQAGWGPRAVHAILMGCVPVVVQHDGVHDPVAQPFQGDLLNWDNFAVIVRRSEVPGDIAVPPPARFGDFQNPRGQTSIKDLPKLNNSDG